MAVDQKVIDNLVKQILASSDSSKWQGEGKGSPQANAADMARILANAGITDIKQFGVRQEVKPAMYYESGETPEQTVNVYYNKETGQELENTYGERQIGSFFGGTYSGKGNTGYGVQFDAQGNPQFFTTGASSSDLTKDTLIALGVMGGIGALGGIGGAGAEGLLSGASTTGAGATTGATVGAEAGGLLTGGAGTVGTTGLTAAELAQLDLALGGAGGTAGAETLAAALTTGATVPTITSLTGGSGLLTGAAGGITADTVAKKLAADATTSGLLTPVGTPGSTPVGTPGSTPTGNPNLTPTGTPGLTPTGTLLNTAATNLLTNAGTNLLGNLTAQQLAGLFSGGLSTAGGLLQQQTSREAAQAAQARIDAETAAAKQAAQFRPVGMTTRFGTSQFTYDPVTGQMVSAGYQLTPEAKAQQDRLMALSNAGLTQAEQAQAQFAPLQTGAQSLFNLGNKYLAQTPEEVAQRYITQQMNLLQPGRELELANLQNKLQQQGRSGLAVAQGGNYGATTPELQALFNARAMQEAQLAANAQQAGQQQVAFGAGLLGQGAGAMGQYYAGQQAAYAPYTTALGQVQNLETMGQQPFGMSTALAQQQAQAGANAGRLGLTGAQLSSGLATSNAATTNPYATVLGGLGSPTSLLGQGLANWTTGLFSSPTTGTAGNPLAVGEFANPGYWT
jgi:hypothetical protein